jgi:hypothetical protein
MNFFPALTAWQFAAAGAICALGPLVIHLLNRRRFRVVQWAAMDFLREAMQRNRRIMQLRDILLLVLRTAAVLLFGLALARPFFASSSGTFDDRQPLHAIIVVDNSLSMGYVSLDGNLLARAKDRARQLIDKLPSGSKISIIPACGSREGYSPDPYDTKENSLEALDKIKLVDRSASIVQVVNEAKKASEAAPELAKRIVFISDQQERNWRDAANSERLKELPAMQVVDVAPPEWENTWVSDVRLQDGIADVETPATVVVQLMHRGTTSRQNVQVSLAMGDNVIGEKTVTLEPGLGAREVDFEFTFNALANMPEPDKPVFVPLKASLAPDHLPADDARFVAIPVVAALPVVFIDQYGAAGEDAIKNRLGETRHLRQLLAPKTARGDAPRQLVRVEHISLDELTQEVLAEARLVVIAGISDPGESVPLLRDYVKQGGQLVIAAGANFDPVAWNRAAWNDGQGILPLPLKSEPIGEVPEVAGANIKPFFLSFESLAGQSYFQLANVSENELRDLYAEPFFFKAVDANVSPETMQAWKKGEAERLAKELTFVANTQKEQVDFAAKEAKQEVSQADRQRLAEAEKRLRELRPQWLAWTPPGTDEAAIELPADEAARAAKLVSLVERNAPRVLARFDSEKGAPFLVERPIGRGNVLLCTTGLLSSWNTLPKTNAVLIFDRVLRSMIQATLPKRNYAAVERVTLPLPVEGHDMAVELFRPGRTNSEPLDIGYIGTDQRGVTANGLYERGVYRIAARRAAMSADPALAAERPLWEIPLVVNGPADESQLDPLSHERTDAIAASGNVRWVAPGEDISLAGTAIRGQYTWWYLILLVLLLLLAEMAILAWPSIKTEPAAS